MVSVLEVVDVIKNQQFRPGIVKQTVFIDFIKEPVKGPALGPTLESPDVKVFNCRTQHFERVNFTVSIFITLLKLFIQDGSKFIRPVGIDV